MPERISVALADDHPIVLAGYHHLLKEDPTITIVGQSGCTTEAIELCQKENPDILVLDLGLPDREEDSQTHTLGGLDVIRALSQRNCPTRILIATMLDTSPVPKRVLQAGASGYLVKTEAAEELLNAVRILATGGRYVSPSIAQALEEGDEEITRLDELSKRELQIFLLLADGLPATEIAEKTRLSPKTVHAHRANILRKLKLKNNSDLVRFALSSGVIHK